jgi:hypothetical protein
MLERLIESLERRPRSMRLLYLNPTEHAQVVGSGRFRLVRTVRALRPTPTWSRSSSTYLYDATG